MAEKTTSRKTTGLALPLLALVLSCAGTAVGGNTGIPEIKKDCSLCHRDTAKGAAGLHKPLSELCLDCHPDRKSPAEHKVDIVPSMAVTGLPLSDNRITCATCHDPHSNVYGKMLRDRPKNLCQRCHKY
ncbi:MAG: hypothetical protein A2078_14290 [Nitrospirae bacterium GWC2_57_9]|nr:MAG: hypothetical protein A2078_14290 [Nitrospirae bacterium GWC2_57_9]